MGLLGDIYSAIDTKKRQVKGLLDDFGGTVDMGVRRFREDQQNLQNLFANAYPMAGDKTVLNSPQQIAQFQREAADKAGEMGLAGATVWHGSPHKFDKFDSSKIGTGEGAQAYGHGLYLAESPDVARNYAQNIMGPTATPENVALKVMNAGNDPVQRLKQVFPKMTDLEVKSAVKSAKSYQGNTYKVDLPDDQISKMLDWDKPLSQQPKSVQDALGGIEGNFGEIPDFNLRKWMDADPLASTWHNVLQRDMGADPAMITKTLKDRGIPGIRYLDGGSRQVPNIANKQLAAAYAKHNGNAEAAVDDIMRGVYETPKEKAKMRAQFIKQLEAPKTSNFVVFPGNEGLLSILERNGQPVGGLLK